MKGYRELNTTIKTALQKKCVELSISFTEEETNAELCTKINNA